MFANFEQKNTLPDFSNFEINKKIVRNQNCLTKQVFKKTASHLVMAVAYLFPTSQVLSFATR